jgi:Flp pilus assembly protein TadD
MLEQCNRTAELDAAGTLKPLFSGFAHVQRGEVVAAVEAHRQAVERANGSGISVAALGYTYAAVGEKRLARAILKRLQELAGNRGMFGYEVGIIRAALGETDAAFEELQRAYRERSSWVTYLDVDPRLDRLRADSRFIGLRDRVHRREMPASEAESR